MDLFYPSHFQVFYRVVRLAEMGCNRLVQLLRPDVRAVSIDLNVERILGFPYVS